MFYQPASKRMIQQDLLKSVSQSVLVQFHPFVDALTMPSRKLAFCFFSVVLCSFSSCSICFEETATFFCLLLALGWVGMKLSLSCMLNSFRTVQYTGQGTSGYVFKSKSHLTRKTAPEYSVTASQECCTKMRKKKKKKSKVRQV